MLVTPQPSLKKIARGVYAWIGANGDSNSGAVDTPEGLLAIDAQQTVSLAQQFRGEVEKASGRPVTKLVDTHFHLDHTAGNNVFADLPILAHDRTLAAMRGYLGADKGGAWMVSDTAIKLRMFFGSNIQELVPPGSAEEAWFVKRMSGPEYETILLKAPSETFADRFTVRLPDDTLHMEYWGPAHCDGDVILHLEKQRVAFLGDLMFYGRFPWFGDCDLDGWIGHLARILTLDIAVVVPGHGPLATLREVAEFRQLLVTVRDAVGAAIKKGASEDAAVNDIHLPQYAVLPRYREWMPFNVRAAYRYLKARA